MNIHKLQEVLQDKFDKDGGTRIVFWYDGEQSYTEALAEIQLPDVTLINMESESSLQVKEKLEYLDTTSRHLLYFPHEEPQYENNWLLDIQLYSRVFTADEASMIFNDLGLSLYSMKDHLKERLQFFKSKKRFELFEKIVSSEDREHELDLKMIAVISKTEQFDIFSIITSIASNIVKSPINFELENTIIKDIEKFNLQKSFYSEIETIFGFHADDVDTNSPEKLFLTFIIRLMVSGFCESFKLNAPNWAKPMIFKSSGLSTARSFLSRWRDSSKYFEDYDLISNWVADELQIKDKINKIGYFDLIEVETFEAVERHIIERMVNELVQSMSPEQRKTVKDIIDLRLQKHWATKVFNDDIRKTYNNAYQALLSSMTLNSLKDKYPEGFHFDDPKSFVHAYASEIYLFDHWYRHYCKYALVPNLRGLTGLNNVIETLYSGWYLDNLSTEWNRLILKHDLLTNWSVEDIINQQDFYKWKVKPETGGTSNRRVAVIISDAFRYEAARELSTEILHDKDKFEVDTSYMLGIVPGYTALGMASLLPHENLSYKRDVADDVFIDGLSTKGTINRNKILSKINGKAVTSDELLKWSRDTGRQEVKNTNVIYVYHDVVDSAGENDENNTFNAVDKAIQELKRLTNKIFNDLNVSTVLITADHGFLFQTSMPDFSDKTKLIDKPECLKNNKRYLVGFNLPANEEVWHGYIKNTASSNCDTEFWVPRGTNRFHFVQGARFIHGGTMPQEIIVPVIKVKSKRGSSVKEKKKVNIMSAEQLINMRNNIRTFKFIQIDRVSKIFLPRSIKVYIEDNDKIVSSTEKISFDSNSELIDDRTKEVKLSLLGQDFNKDKDYSLIISDLDTNIEISRATVKIDLAFQNDFFS